MPKWNAINRDGSGGFQRLCRSGCFLIFRLIPLGLGFLQLDQLFHPVVHLSDRLVLSEAQSGLVGDLREFGGENN